MPRSLFASWGMALVAGLGNCCAQAAAPVLYDQPAYQSPVHGGPDQLLLLAGSGFAHDDIVVYQSIDDDNVEATRPVKLPTLNTAATGLAKIVSIANTPYSLTVLLPEVLHRRQAYALWVRNAAGEWSRPVRINDPRPLWMTPAYVHESAMPAGLPRALKLVGRNLDSTAARLRLTGPQTIELDVDVQDEALLGFVAQVALPAVLKTGRYRIAMSHDGGNWISLPGQELEVRPDPVIKQTFSPADAQHGGCHPDDGRDDTRCVVNAIAAAQRKGGGTVLLGRGTWDLTGDDPAIGKAGIEVPEHIDLLGAGATLTRIVRHAAWNSALRPAFTLRGQTQVQALRFVDQQHFSTIDQANAFLQLGPVRAGDNTLPVTGVIITDNVFDRVMVGIRDGGAPLREVFIARNEFGAFHIALRLDGNRFNVGRRFNVEDGVIRDNVFKPGGLLNVPDRQGPIASELGAGRRIDFSDNRADGAAIDYLYAGDTATGWRAAFFWHLNGNQEQLLIAGNSATCTGDRVGDGEGIAYDNNGNTFGFDHAVKVEAASADSLTVGELPLAKQHGRDVPLSNYYLGHWLQIGSGPGLGQARRITSYRIDRMSRQVTFTVAPGWDVVPVPGQSKISVSRIFWQTYTLNNFVDHRQPLCAKSNRSEPKGGVIGLWATMYDSVVANNQQFDSDGILFQNQYSERVSSCADCNRGTFMLGFVEISNNLIDGEYRWDDDCSSSGILGSLAASPGDPPLTVNYAMNIEGNVIRQADAWRGGAIAFTPSWYVGPAPHRWPLVSNVLIQHNRIEGFWDTPARGCRRDAARPRTGIELGMAALVANPVLYANRCGRIPRRLGRNASQPVTSLCRQGMTDSCECRGQDSP